MTTFPHLVRPKQSAASLQLQAGARVAVIGGGPAGSLFAYFLMDLAERVELGLHVDIFEWRDFSRTGPAGCNMCGGIISESLVQALATDGINLPNTIVERALDSYVLRMDVGTVRIKTPLDEKRIGAVHRGAGPKDLKEKKWGSFDAYLLELALKKGCELISQRAEQIRSLNGQLEVLTRPPAEPPYDLVALAVGVNAPVAKLIEPLGLPYRPPESAKTYICEFCLGADTIRQYFGGSMQVFLQDIPKLEFAALIPKGDYVTLCLLGSGIDDAMIQTFLNSPEVRACFPPGWSAPQSLCHCSPKISTQAAKAPFGDRIVFVGDCGVTRLYKDGIGAAYRTAKAAARTAVFDGISEAAFRRSFWPVCRAIQRDNRLGKLVFFGSRQLQKARFARRALLQVVAQEQEQLSSPCRLSTVLWDTFTGSAPYAHIFAQCLHPKLLMRLAWQLLRAPFHSRVP